MGKKKTSTAVCDFIDGSRNALNFAGDVLVDTGFGIGAGLAVATFPEATIPAILSSSAAGQAILGNLFSGLTDSAKSTIHGLTEKLVPDSCKPEPVIIPMGDVTPKTSIISPSKQSQTSVLNIQNNK